MSVLARGLRIDRGPDRTVRWGRIKIFSNFLNMPISQISIYQCLTFRFLTIHLSLCQPSLAQIRQIQQDLDFLILYLFFPHVPTVYWSMQGHGVMCIFGNARCISWCVQCRDFNEPPHFAPSQKSIFGSSPLSIWAHDHQMEKSLSLSEQLRHHFPFIPQNIARPPPPNPNWFGFRNKSDSRFAFEWGPGARIYIIGLDYVGSDINRASQRCHRDEGYFVLTDFFPVSICPHICNCNRPQETSKLEGRGSNMKKYWDIHRWSKW